MAKKGAEVLLLPLDGESILPSKINNSITGTVSFFRHVLDGLKRRRIPAAPGQP